MKTRLVISTTTILALAAAFVSQAVPQVGDHEAALVAMMDASNVALAVQGAAYRIAMAEYITAGSRDGGNRVFSKDVGNKQADYDFVPFDPRRSGWSGLAGGPADNITYAVDQTMDAVPPLGGLSGAATTAAIDRAMATWNGVQCSTLPIAKNPDFGVDIGVIAFFFGLGGNPFILADVQHAGWRDISFGGGIVAVTFTLVFVAQPENVFTDIDNNGKADVAFNEIYYDPSFSWADNGVTNIDVETTALHEAGHGLGQAHFGKVFIKNDGSIKASPRAVMNAFYLGPQRSLLGTDIGGHCGNWASWPRK